MSNTDFPNSLSLSLILALCPSHLSLPAVPLNYIQCPHRTNVSFCWSANSENLLDIFSYGPISPPPARAGYDTRSIFKRSLTGLNSEFSFSKTSCLTKAEEPSLSYYLPIAGGRIIRFIPFPRVLVLCEM